MVIIVPLTVRRLALLHYLFTPHYVGAELGLSTHILYADERFLSQCNRARFIESRFWRVRHGAVSDFRAISIGFIPPGRELV